jgi:hypothetical protein
MDGWTDRLDLVNEIRRETNRVYGFRASDEMKGEWIAGVKKHFRERRLGDGQLRDIYARNLRVAQVVASGAMAVILRKELIRKPDLNLEEWAWRMLFQRLRMRTIETGAPIVLVIDNSSRNAAVTALLRRFRRWDWVSGKQISAPLLIEDPVPRLSQHSHFVQIADLAAFAASRRVLPSLGVRGKICHPDMWNELGSARIVAASGRRDGIVAWP